MDLYRHSSLHHHGPHRDELTVRDCYLAKGCGLDDICAKFWQQRTSVAPAATGEPAVRPTRLPLQFYGIPASGTSDSFSRSFGVKCCSLWLVKLFQFDCMSISRWCSEHSQFIDNSQTASLDQTVLLPIAVAAVQTLKDSSIIRCC